MAGPGKKNPFLSGFLLGLFAGLALAITVALLVTRNNPFAGGSAVQDADGTSSSTAPAAPAEAPKYEFYQALPEGQPGTMPAAAPSVPTYFLQAGAYGNAAEADQVKARLALLGFEASILSAQEGETTLHKVRIGPFKGLDELNSARARLTQNGVDTILVKIAPQQQEKP
jgi:cell division protein FtsN